MFLIVKQLKRSCQGQQCYFNHEDDYNLNVSAKVTHDNSAAITYSSSDENVAKFSGGLIIFEKAGTATITATFAGDASYGENTAELELTIKRVIQNPFSNTNGLNYVTFYNDLEDLVLPSGLVAYIITGVNGNSVTTSATGYLPHNVPVLLEKTAALDDDLTFNGYSGDAGDFSGNKLKHTTTEIPTTDNTYVLYKNEFVKATNTIPIETCYLDLSGVAPSRGMYGIGDGSTVIDATLMDHEGMNKEEWYDLQGRRIQKPTKAGIYIKNGKKIVVNNK